MLLPISLPAEPSLDQDTLNISDKTRVNQLAWNGQFSPQLIESILKTFGAESSVIFDPFAGSGTVASEATRLGKSFVGAEVNPAAFLLARIYSLASTGVAQREIALHAVQVELDALCKQFPLPEHYDALIATLVRAAHDSPSNEIKIIWCAMTLLAYKSADTTTIELLRRAFAKISLIVHALPQKSVPVSLVLGDARTTPFEDGQCDFAVTSPPYINVYNYHQQYRPIVEELGCKPLKAAPTEIGSNRKHRGNRFLTVVQYCLDIAQAIVEMFRICRPGSRVIFIIGHELNVLGLQFFNAEIVNSIVVGMGISPLLLRQQRVFKNRFGQNIHEDILHFCASQSTLTKAMLEHARTVGVAALQSAKASCGVEQEELLNQAIARSDQIDASPKLNTFSVIPTTLLADA